MPLDAHGCPACPHPGVGPAIQGSPDVNVNHRPALRVDDPGIHFACCGTNTWTATQGSMTVFINGKGAHRMGDQNRHCGGMGQLIEGSPNVIVGESGGGGGGGRAGGSARTSSQAAGSGNGGGAGSSAGTGGSAGGDRTGDGGAPAAATDAPATDDARPAHAVDEDQIEVLVVNVNNLPVADLAFELTLPDGSTKTGRTAGDGFIRFSHLTQRGECTLEFPEIENPPGGENG